MTSLATEYYQIFLAQGVMFGIGAGGIFTSSFVCVGQWFVKRRGLAVGLASVGSSLGGVIFPLFFDKVIAAVGFPGAMRYSALLVAVPLVIGCFLVRSRLPRKQWDKQAKSFDLSLFREPQFALYTLGSFLVMWGLWVPLDFIASFATAQGFSSVLALSLISIINAASIPGRILPAFLSDHIGHFNVITVSDWLVGVSILCLWLPFDFDPSHAGIIIFCLVYGFVSGAFVSLLMPCVAKTGSIETIGMRFGTFQMAIGLSNLTGLPISGAILARQGDATYCGLQTFAIVATLLGAALTTVSTRLIAGKKGTWKI
ncbi:hypothetical protein LTR36_004735 [Oleoguttula mirabilis]|uniref:Uncharacterized protein n=1 Tax=Oleoguttula mirabilis TaxID=1507867 RepID=A0AAV9JFS5_9PEZI|nr:hypothetical protein LTR36_004735 [Oleoguttula mirabilis]